MILNVKHFGAKGDGATDDLPAIQAAVDVVRAQGGGVLRFPAGVYIRDGRINISGLANTVICGDGRGASVIKLREAGHDWVNEGGDIHCFLGVGVRNLTFRDFTIDGSWDYIQTQNPTINEQMHGLYLGCPDVYQQAGGSVSNILVEGVEFYNLRGDGMYLIGDEIDNGRLVRNVKVRGCDFLRNGRSGIANQGGLRAIKVVDNYFYGMADQDIDMEPTGYGSIEDYLIEGNTFHRTGNSFCLTVVGLDDAVPTKNVRVIGNDFTSDGAPIAAFIQFSKADNCKFAYNHIYGTVQIRNFIDRLDISHNDITYPNDTAGSLISLLSTNTAGNITIKDNHLTQQSADAFGIITFGGEQIEVSGNTIINTAGGTAGVDGIGIGRVVGQEAVQTTVKVLGNTIKNFVNGIGIGPHVDNPFASVTIMGNVFDDDQETPTQVVGILLSSNGIGSGVVDHNILIANNQYGRGIVMPVSDPDGDFRYYLSERSSTRTYHALTDGEPGAIVNDITPDNGDRFIRKDAAAGSPFYFHEGGVWRGVTTS